MVRLKLFLEWYRLLRTKQYSRLSCINYAWYNSRYYTVDGKYRIKK